MEHRLVEKGADCLARPRRAHQPADRGSVAYPHGACLQVAAAFCRRISSAGWGDAQRPSSSRSAKKTARRHGAGANRPRGREILRRDVAFVSALDRKPLYYHGQPTLSPTVLQSLARFYRPLCYTATMQVLLPQHRAADYSVADASYTLREDCKPE
jgi:hypothetical protein